MMYSEPRNWKWMLPGAGFALAVLATRMLLLSSSEFMRWGAVVTGIVAGLCAVASVGNLVDYRRAQAVTMLERRQSAISRTPLSAELEAARGVHPDITRLIINERKRAWMLRGSDRHDVLYGAPTVTDIFVRFFLENSSTAVVLPKRLLVDGRKNRFDPMGETTEYQMYDDLVKLLLSEGKIHRWSEYSPWEWVPPWNPRSVAEDLRLVLDVVEESMPEPDMAETLI